MPQSSPLNNVLKIHMGDLSGVSADVAFLLDGTIAKAFYASIGRPDVYAKMEPDSWGRRRKGFPPDLAFSHGTKQMMVSYVIQAVAPEWLQHYYRSFWDSAAFVGSAQGTFELLTKAPSASTGLFVAPDTGGDEAFTRICASQLLRAVELSPLSKNMIYVKDQGTLDVYESLWGRRGRGMPTQPKSGRSLQVIIEPSREVPKPISHDRHTASLRVSRYLGSSDGEANESLLLLGSEGELNTVDDGLVKPHLHGREILFLIDYDVSAFSQYVFGLANGTTAMKIAVTVLPHKFLRKEKSLIEGVTESTIRGSDFSIRIDPDRFLDADPIAGESFESNSMPLDL